MTSAENIAMCNSTKILGLMQSPLSWNYFKKGELKRIVWEYLQNAITFSSEQQISMRNYLLVQSKENLLLKETNYLKREVIGYRKNPI